MNIGFKIFLGFIAFIILMLALTLGFGWFGVYQTKTVGKAQENARREVFEETQSYVEGKRQDLIKLHHEWKGCNDADKLALESTIRMQFSSFSEDKYLTDYPEIHDWLRYIKTK
jgi:hypothetical protein